MNTGKSKGFTIIEVLIAMIILAVGVLGLGVMQLTSMQNTQSGQMRSQASILAYDMIDTMRTNIVSVTSGTYNLGLDEETPDAIECYGAGANCNPAQMAFADLDHWRTTLASSLPTGTGGIGTVDLGAGTTEVTITISWIDPYTAANGAEQLVIVSELPQ